MNANDFPLADWHVEKLPDGGASDYVLWSKVTDGTYLFLFVDLSSEDVNHAEAKAAAFVNINFVEDKTSCDLYVDLYDDSYEEDDFLHMIGEVPF